MRMSRTRARAALKSFDRRNVAAVQALEPRVCLAVADVEFLAGNYSFDDPAFVAQAASTANMRSVELTVPDDMPRVAGFPYPPYGNVNAAFAWAQPRSMQRTKPGNPPTTVVARAFSQVKVSTLLRAIPPTIDPDVYLAQMVGALATQGYTRAGGTAQVQVPWKVSGGGFNGVELSIKGLEGTYVKSTTAVGLDLHEQVLDDAFFLGYAPNGNAIYLNVIMSVGSSVDTSDPSVIPLQEATTQLLGQTPAARDADVFAAILPTLKFKGAIPETLFLYDFSHRSTISPTELAYIDQYEQSDLPLRFDVHGGNACGPSSLTMALDEIGTPPAVSVVYDNTMQIGLDVGDDVEQAFAWDKAETWTQKELSNSHTVKFNQNDTWEQIERNLNGGAEVVLRTELTERGDGRGKGHVILLLGAGNDPAVKNRVKQLYPFDTTGDYFIVADPAGNFFADATTGGLNQGHYGTVDALRAKAKGLTYGGRFAIYPKGQLQQFVSRMWTLTIDPLDSTAKVTVHSPVSVVVTDPLGRKTGIRPDGSVLEEIPNSGYQVAVGEEEESGFMVVDPEQSKGVLLNNAIPGTYQVDLVGTGTGPYTVDISTSLPGQPRSVTTYTGASTPGSTAHYTFTMPGVGRPQVQQVYADSSAWTPAFRQFMQTTGAGDANLGYRVSAGDTLPWTHVDRLVLRFDSDLPASPLPAKVTLDGARADYTATPSGLDARTLLLKLDQPLGAAGGDRVRVVDDAIGGSPDFRFNVLPGDVDRSGAVLANDFSDVKKRFFKSTANPGAGDTGYTIFHDVDGSGSIVAGDFSEVKKRFFNTLPAPQPSPAAVTAMTPRRPRTRERYLDLLTHL